MSKLYHFHIETFHLPAPYDEKWFQDFPFELTDEQFDRLCKEHAAWIETERFKKRNDLDDDEYFLHRYVPDVWEKFRSEIAERAPKMWDEGIIPHLYNIDLYVAEEVWDVNRPYD